MHSETKPNTMIVPAILLIVSGATIAAAWGFELIGGFVPCALCLEQRIPYYIGVPVAFLALLMIRFSASSWLSRLLLAIAAIVFAYGAYLGLYHAGAEWGFWPGPADCAAGAAPPTSSATDILSQMQGVRIVSCTEASWRFPTGWGLSFAGWNAAISIFLVAIALWGLAKKQPA